MIDWVLANRHHIVRTSRWIVAGCAAALLAVSNLPHTPFGRVVAVVGIAAIALVFFVWLGIVLIAVLRPHAFQNARRRRVDRD
jgi:hypothetical protein